MSDIKDEKNKETPIDFGDEENGYNWYAAIDQLKEAKELSHYVVDIDRYLSKSSTDILYNNLIAHIAEHGSKSYELDRQYVRKCFNIPNQINKLLQVKFKKQNLDVQIYCSDHKAALDQCDKDKICYDFHVKINI